MQFLQLLVAAATIAVGQAIQFDNSAYVVTAGKTFNLTWSDASGPVSLILKDGPATALVTVETIASGLSGTSYAWAVPATLPSNTYAFEIDDSTGKNYSPLWQLIGGAAAQSSASSAAPSTTMTTSGSSAAPSTSASAASNGTTTSGSAPSSSAASKTGSSSTGTGTAKTSTASTPASTTSAPSSASGFSSPLAFVFLALAAFFTLN